MVIEDLIKETDNFMENTIDSIQEILKYRKLSSPYCLGGLNILFDYSDKKDSLNLVYKLNKSLNKKYGIQVEYIDKRVSLVPIDGPSKEILIAYKDKYMPKIENNKSV